MGVGRDENPLHNISWLCGRAHRYSNNTIITARSMTLLESTISYLSDIGITTPLIIITVALVIAWLGAEYLEDRQQNRIN